MDYQIHVKQVEAQPTAVVRRRASLVELPQVIPPACGEVWTFVKTFGREKLRPGHNLALYLDAEINLEVGVEVPEPFAGNDQVICSNTPAGQVATAIHIGPYNRLHEAHIAIRDWCAANGHPIAGPNWEIYGHWQEEWNNDPSKICTDVFYLLKPTD